MPLSFFRTSPQLMVDLVPSRSSDSTEDARVSKPFQSCTTPSRCTSSTRTPPTTPPRSPDRDSAFRSSPLRVSPVEDGQDMWMIRRSYAFDEEDS